MILQVQASSLKQEHCDNRGYDYLQDPREPEKADWCLIRDCPFCFTQWLHDLGHYESEARFLCKVDHRKEPSRTGPQTSVSRSLLLCQALLDKLPNSCVTGTLEAAFAKEALTPHLGSQVTQSKTKAWHLCLHLCLSP